MTTAARGRLIAIEGIDGSGKSTQARLLAERLGALSTFEPGATGIGSALRHLLLDRDATAVAERTEALLMAADRAQHIVEIVAPALEKGTWVVSDRYAASTLAYQGYGRGVDIASLEPLLDWATGGLEPDVTVFVDVPVAEAVSRLKGAEPDRFEGEGAVFLQRVADGYRRLAAGMAASWVVVDGSRSVEEVAAEVWRNVVSVVGEPPGHAG